MLVDPEVRSRYLSLALDARRIIDKLAVFIERGERGSDFYSSIGDALDSLRATTDAGALISAVHAPLSFTHYEQIRTLSEILDERLNLVLQQLVALSNQERDAHELETEALSALEFFSELETRALHHYQQPGAIDSQLACRIA
jgi:hypothetical protein